METFVFLVAGAICLVRRPRRRAVGQPRPLGAVAGGHAVRRRRAVRRPGGQLPRRRAGHRLRRRHRRAVPVRDHAARRRPHRGPRRRAASSASASRRSWSASPCSPCPCSPSPRSEWAATGKRSNLRQPRQPRPTSRPSARSCSPATCWRSRSPRSCSSSPSSAPCMLAKRRRSARRSPSTVAELDEPPTRPTPTPTRRSAS